MTLAPFDPFRAEYRLRWHNRLEHWRAERAQSLFHLCALLALTALLLPLAMRGLRAAGPILLTYAQQHPLLVACVVIASLALRHMQRLAALQRNEVDEWLVAQPISPRLRTRRRRDRVLTDLGLHALSAATLLALVGATHAVWGSTALCLALAAWSAFLLSYEHRQRQKTSPLARWPDRGAGRFWRWQRIEAGAALRGGTLAPGLYLLLLVPIDSPILTTLIVIGSGFAFVMLATAWRRSVGVLLQAQAWLEPQPLHGARLMAASAWVPIGVLATASALLAAACFALGVFAFAIAMPLALMALGTLHFLCVAAERTRPPRVILRYLVSLTLLLAVLQIWPPLALPCWILQVATLWRKAKQP